VLGQAVPDQVPNPVPERQDGLYRRKSSITAGGRQRLERIGEVLEVGDGDERERLPCPTQNPVEIGAVGALGMDGAAVEPDGEELLVGVRPEARK
jgi:hypothetical protein